ncbi:MAG: DUF4342 domain-containing protein [Lapillicoccus sp.]
MSSSEQTASADHGDEASSAGPPPERLSVRGEALAAKVKELLHEGTVRRITVKNREGRTIMEIPVTAGLVVAVIAPVLTAVSALAAVASDWEIEVHRTAEAPAVAGTS